MTASIRLAATITITLMLSAAGCDAIFSASASLGGATAGQRGTARVLFINNTPFRAIFLFGAFDDLDQNTQPSVTQFNSQNILLEGNTESAVANINCARVFSVGGEGLIFRIRENLPDGTVPEALLFEGVKFSSAPVGDEDADAATEGVAAPLDARIGVDFECNSLLVYRLEINDLGPEPFTVQLTAIPSESTR